MDQSIKVVLSCLGKFHHFDLARQLDSAGLLEVIYTGYPRCKLRGERLAPAKISTFPWFQTIYMAQARFTRRSEVFSRCLERIAKTTFDSHVARILRPCDIFVGLSGHNRKAGRRARALGARWICDRGSSHILYQDRVLREEHIRWGIPFRGVPSWAIKEELVEYAECDLITVPSTFAEKSFVDAGVAAAKLRRVPYGVDLTKFMPVGSPKSGHYDVIFVGSVGVRKGIPYLIEAFRNIRHPRKSLRIIGSIEPVFESWVRNIKDADVLFMGPLPQPALKEHLSRSHVFVLPSVEEGLALVQAQALACGCPIICTPNTGGGDLITSGIEGLIVEARNPGDLTHAMQILADNTAVRERMGELALASVQRFGGWNEYGERYHSVLRECLGEC